MFNALRLSIEVLAEVLPEVLADVTADITNRTELKARAKIQQLEELKILLIAVHY